MKLIEFIKRLKEISPKRASLVGEGFEGRHLDVILSCYNLPIKDTNSANLNDSTIINLSNRYDVSFIRFGDYAFEKEVITLEDGSIVFCTSSGTYLFIEHLNGEVMELDKDDDSLIQYCALNEACFLDSLLYILELESIKLQGEFSNNWQEVLANLYAKAIEASGGNKYKMFLKQFF